MEPVKVDGLQKKGVEEWTSSKGNQNKWFQEAPCGAGCWYKEDGLGYEIYIHPEEFDALEALPDPAAKALGTRYKIIDFFPFPAYTIAKT